LIPMSKPPREIPDDLATLIRSPTSRENIERVSSENMENWLSKIKSMSQEYLIDRILDNLSQILSNYLNVVQVTVTNDLTIEKISQRQEFKDAPTGTKREFTFELQPQNLPAIKPWVEFVPKLGGMVITKLKLRFEYDAKPEVAAKVVKVTLLNNHLSDIYIDSLSVSIGMSMYVNGNLIKLGTLNRTLKIQRSFYETPRTSTLETTKHPDETGVPRIFCIECGNELSSNAKFCNKCGSNQS